MVLTGLNKIKNNHPKRPSAFPFSTDPSLPLTMEYSNTWEINYIGNKLHTKQGPETAPYKSYSSPVSLF